MLGSNIMCWQMLQKITCSFSYLLQALPTRMLIVKVVTDHLHIHPHTDAGHLPLIAVVAGDHAAGVGQGIHLATVYTEYPMAPNFHSIKFQ